jgi:hypothetical protein
MDGYLDVIPFFGHGTFTLNAVTNLTHSVRGS